MSNTEKKESKIVLCSRQYRFVLSNLFAKFIILVLRHNSKIGPHLSLACYSWYKCGCPPVRGGDSQALAGGVYPIKVDTFIQSSLGDPFC